MQDTRREWVMSQQQGGEKIRSSRTTRAHIRRNNHQRTHKRRCAPLRYKIHQNAQTTVSGVENIAAVRLPFPVGSHCKGGGGGVGNAHDLPVAHEYRWGNDDCSVIVISRGRWWWGRALGKPPVMGGGIISPFIVDARRHAYCYALRALLEAGMKTITPRAKRMAIIVRTNGWGK